MRARKTLGGIVVAFTLLIATGCTSSTPTGYEVPSISSQVDVAHLVLPLDSYQLTDSQLQRMDTEWAQLMSRCASSYGATITYTSDYTRNSKDEATYYWGGHFGTLSKTQASRFGYHALTTGPFQPAPGFYLKNPDNIVMTGNPSPADSLISYGRPKDKNNPAYSATLPVDTAGQPLPDGGCFATVQSKIGTKLVSDLDLRRQLIELALDDSRTQEAIKNWSTCMQSAGYSFKRPMDAEAAWGILNPAEVKQAVADVNCTENSKWSAIFYTILVGYQKQAIDRESQLLQSVLQSQQRVLKALDSLGTK